MPVTSPGTPYCFLCRLGREENERMNAESAWRILKHHVTLTNICYYVKQGIHGIGCALSYSFYFYTVCFFPLLSSYVAPRPSSNKHGNLSFLYNLSQLPRYSSLSQYHRKPESWMTSLGLSWEQGIHTFVCHHWSGTRCRLPLEGVWFSPAEAILKRLHSWGCENIFIPKMKGNVTCHMHQF